MRLSSARSLVSSSPGPDTRTVLVHIHIHQALPMTATDLSRRGSPRLAVAPHGRHLFPAPPPPPWLSISDLVLLSALSRPSLGPVPRPRARAVQTCRRPRRCPGIIPPFPYQGAIPPAPRGDNSPFPACHYHSFALRAFCLHGMIPRLENAAFPPRRNPCVISSNPSITQQRWSKNFRSTLLCLLKPSTTRTKRRARSCCGVQGTNASPRRRRRHLRRLRLQRLSAERTKWTTGAACTRPWITYHGTPTKAPGRTPARVAQPAC